MSPQIRLTGSDKPLRFIPEPLPGEPDEAARSTSNKKVFAASDYVGLGRKEKAIHVLSSPDVQPIPLGMPVDIASELVTAAIEGDRSVTVICETIFEKQGKIGGRRHYENWQLVRK